MMFTIVNGAVAVSADDYLTPKTRNFKTTHNKAFQIPHSRTEHYKQLFFPKTITNWNKLSFETVNSANLDEFKIKLKPEINKLFT